MKNNKNVVCKTYDEIADWYDEHRSRHLFEKKWLDKAVTYLSKGSQVLDLGCGTGTPMIPYFLEKCFGVTGVDGSVKLIALAKSRYPNADFIILDMRDLNLNRKFDLIIAWNSLFHLSQNDQRAMFNTFASHLNIGGILLFTSGSEAGEILSDNGGRNLYHASLSSDEYKVILHQNNFALIEYKISDSECGGATVWLAKLELTYR